jgi:uncharacterized protein
MQIELAGTRWALSPQRAAFWLDQRMLLVADAHFGKAATFRARGVPVPAGTTGGNLARLDELIADWQPRCVVFLGDLFHAREAHAPDTIAALARWRGAHAALDMVLVEGNHDRHAGAPPASLGLRVVQEPWRADGDAPVALAHHPQRLTGCTIVAGHMHPCVRLYGAANDRLRLPCFWQRDGLMLLPAFGDFTGGALIAREPGDTVIAAAEDRLIRIPARSVTLAG